MIIIDNVVAGYRTRAGLVKAVDRISMEVRDGEILGVAGESGCGKTTLLNLIYGRFDAGLEIFSGSVVWRSADGRQSIDCREFHRHWWKIFTYIPQGSMSALNPLMRIEAQMLDAGEANRRDEPGARRARIRRTLAELGLADRAPRLYPHQLSGGMRQRVMIGLAAHIDPQVILADEPTTALDVVVQRQIVENLVRLQRAQGNTIVIVSHDLGLHYQMTQRIAVLYAGRLAEIGPTDQVLRHPAHPYTRGLVESLPRIGDKSPRAGIEGRPPDLASPPPGCRFAARCPRVIDACRDIDPEPTGAGEDRAAACIRLAEQVA